MVPCGHCYKNAYDHMIALIDNGDGALVLLIHGSIVPHSGPYANQRITHAWVEVGAMVHEFSNGKALITERDRFATAFLPDVYMKYSPEDAMMNYLRNMHYGPWDETSVKMGEAECKSSAS